MHRLGYPRYAAQGGDWGAAITTIMGHDAPAALAGIQVNMPLCLPDPSHASNDPDDVTLLQNLAQYGRGSRATLFSKPLGRRRWATR